VKRFGRFACLFLSVAAAGATVLSFAQERQMGGVGITVFADPNFRGKSSTFRQDVPDLEPFRLNDKISSLRVGPGEQWEVCERSNYKGRCVVVSGDEPDLRRNSWNDLISSIRRVKRVPPRPPSAGPSIVLFDRTNYRGTSTNYSRSVSNLNRSAQSVTIGKGVWELCEGRNFTGRCVTLDNSVPDLGSYNLRNRVSSARPIGSGGSQPPPSTSDWYIVIFDRPLYQGNSTNYNRPETNIFKLARSVTIGRGVWELCQGKDFTGLCVTLNTSVPDLSSYNLRQVSSLRPVTRQPR